MTPLVRLATCDPVLARRTRYGDRSAARRLAARHLDRISELASVVGATAEESETLARQAFSLALRGGRPFEDALIRAFSRLAAALPDAEDARARLAVLLSEVEQRPVPEVARLLGVTPSAVDALLPRARAAVGSSYPARACRGWGLVSRRAGLTAAEKAAGEAHLLLCRRCSDRLAVVDRTRAQLLGGSAGMVGVAAVAQVVPWTGLAATGATGVLGTKAVAGAIAVVGGAVLATGGTTVVVKQQAPHRPPARVQQVQPSTPTTHVAPSHLPAVEPAPTPTPSSTRLPVLPSGGVTATVVPTDVPSPVLPLPTVPVLPLPTLPPVELPDPLPSLLHGLLG